MDVYSPPHEFGHNVRAHLLAPCTPAALVLYKYSKGLMTGIASRYAENALDDVPAAALCLLGFNIQLYT